VFDAYGTLFDVYSVISLCDRKFPGHGQALSKLWRAKQLEYTWLRSLMGRYEDFWAVTEAALVFSCKSLGLDCPMETRNALMESYLRLTPFPETAESLEMLAGRPLAILSNGSPRMLLTLVENSGLAVNFAAILSVDDLKIYKPDPRVYQMAVDKLSIPKGEIGFVSSNFWDAAGATAFGFRTFWINRGNVPPDELGLVPGVTITSLRELAATAS
jgi:2-haloacid dehalogenase